MFTQFQTAPPRRWRSAFPRATVPLNTSTVRFMTITRALGLTVLSTLLRAAAETDATDSWPPRNGSTTSFLPTAHRCGRAISSPCGTTTERCSKAFGKPAARAGLSTGRSGNSPSAAVSPGSANPRRATGPAACTSETSATSGESSTKPRPPQCRRLPQDATTGKRGRQPQQAPR